MSTQEITTEQLSAAFNRCFETKEAPEGLFADDAFFDLFPPLWRFQLVGPSAFAVGSSALPAEDMSVLVDLSAHR